MLPRKFRFMFIVAKGIKTDIGEEYKINFSNWFSDKDRFITEIQLGGNKSRCFHVEDLHTEALLALFDHIPTVIQNEQSHYYRNALDLTRFVRQIADLVVFVEYKYRIYGLDGVLK